MTLQEKVDFIRSKCVEANPTDDRWNVILSDQEEVRLADILLALKESLGDEAWKYAIDAEGRFMYDWGDGGHETISKEWNLKQDSLTWHAENRPEVIDFIYSLLSK